MSTKVYAVLAWDDYYPCYDNTQEVFSSYELALAYKETIEANEEYENYDIAEWEIH